MILKNLIDKLSKEPQDNILRLGFNETCSWRGSYNEVAFIIAYRVSVCTILFEYMLKDLVQP